ncbi:MAG: peptidoglycan-binding protein [Clostridia bacterium]|nr:peptidoglycan-binding protein [Clostridia bacterium]
MAEVMIGSARGDERGCAYGGAAGDQTGREVSAQAWYNHPKGWRVFRCADREKARLIARAMRAACANDMIGYDQHQRLTLYRAAEKRGFDPSLVVEPAETDCSALVRVCLAFAGIETGNFTTDTEARALLDTGEFAELAGEKYTARADALREGDVLVTAVKGHTAVVLNDGLRADEPVEPSMKRTPGSRTLRNGARGDDVRAMQRSLIALGYGCGSWGADGEFGDATELALRAFQRSAGIAEDGVFGPESLAALDAALTEADGAEGGEVLICGGSCWVRARPGTDAEKLGVAREGTRLAYLNEASENGWLRVKLGNKSGWVSGRYGRLVHGARVG